MKPLDESKLPTLRQFDTKNRDEIQFLHGLLNYHLPDGDRLPVEGSGTFDFGPRTLAKVKQFQEVNKIDIGTPDFKDGIVGKKTWKKLLEKQQVLLSVVAAPPPMPPLPPILPPLLLPPLDFPRLQPLPFPRPKIFSLQFQIGQQGQFPFNSRPSAAHSLQIAGVMLLRKDKDGPKVEGQIGQAISFNRGGKPDDSKTDLTFSATLNLADMPGSADPFTWSIQAQMAVLRSLNKLGPPSGQASVVVGASLTLIKRNGIDVLQLTGQAGLYLQAQPPPAGKDTWDVTAGATSFFGFTGTIGSF